MKRGNKINASLPEFIFLNKKYVYSFLRGLFDTDGSLKFSKQAKTVHYYPRLELGFKNSSFISQITKIVNLTEIPHSVWVENRMTRFTKFQISGANNLEIWMNKIGSKNPVHITKYLFWKKYGCYKIHSSLIYRLNALNLNINDLSMKLN